MTEKNRWLRSWILYLLLIKEWWSVYQTGCVCLCRLHCLVIQTPSYQHMVNTRVLSVVWALRENTSFVVTRPHTMAATPVGVRYVERVVWPLMPSDATLARIQVYVTTSVICAHKNSRVRGAWQGTSVTFIQLRVNNSTGICSSNIFGVGLCMLV